MGFYTGNQDWVNGTDHDASLPYNADDVVYDPANGRFLAANDSIPAGTAITIGTSGATWRVVGGGGDSVLVQPVQTADFAATAGAAGLEHLWPVDISGNDPTSVLTITAPASPAIGDRFSVADHRLEATATKTIRVELAQGLMGLPGPDYATINSAGAKFVFTYLGGAIGWEVASNVNE